MPATYAHYRFGAQMLKRMPADICPTAKCHRRMYDVGLHGPDLFFFYKPARSTQIGRLGNKYHRQTGKVFFSRVCRNLRMEPGEAGKAYLYGVLCHYVLDACCHPLVERYSWEGIACHTRVETEFDRFLMERDGIHPPKDMRLTGHMRLTKEEAAIVSRFYPGTEAKHILDSLKGMTGIRKALELPEGPVRSLVIKTMSAGSEIFRDMVITDQPDKVCRELDDPLFERYRRAETLFPEMLRQLRDHLAHHAPLGAEFDAIFG